MFMFWSTFSQESASMLITKMLFLMNRERERERGIERGQFP